MSDSAHLPTWSVGQPAPPFDIGATHGSVGPQDFRNEWLIVLHCRSWRGAACSTCAGNFDALSLQLLARRCHLLVAVDKLAAEDPLPNEGPSKYARRNWTLGQWLAPIDQLHGNTQVAVIDPAGIVRALGESVEAAPLRWQWLLSMIDSAQGRTVAPVPQHGDPAVAYGCVDWFEYDPTAHPVR
jgi:hypothetical protein